MTMARLCNWWLPQHAALLPFHVTVPPDCIVRRRGVRATRRRLEVDDVFDFEGLRLTTPARTLADLAADHSLIDMVVMADFALGSRACTEAELALIASQRGGRGVRTIRRAAALADRAASLRWKRCCG
jgi:hypothetical protein